MTANAKRFHLWMDFVVTGAFLAVQTNYTTTLAPVVLIGFLAALATWGSSDAPGSVAGPSPDSFLYFTLEGWPTGKSPGADHFAIFLVVGLA